MSIIDSLYVTLIFCVVCTGVTTGLICNSNWTMSNEGSEIISTDRHVMPCNQSGQLMLHDFLPFSPLKLIGSYAKMLMGMKKLAGSFPLWYLSVKKPLIQIMEDSSDMQTSPRESPQQPVLTSPFLLDLERVFKRAMGPVTEKLESIKDQLTSVPQSFGEAYGDQLTGASQDTAETQSAQGSSETLDTVSCEGGRSLTCAREKTLMAALRRMILSLTTRIG